MKLVSNEEEMENLKLEMMKLKIKKEKILINKEALRVKILLREFEEDFKKQTVDSTVDLKIEEIWGIK